MIIALIHYYTCSRCGGSGRIGLPGNRRKCPSCNGSGSTGYLDGGGQHV